MLVRPAIDEDIEALRETHRSSFPRGWSFDEFAHFLSRPDIYSILVAGSGAEDKNLLSAFILLSLAGDEAEIVTLCVEPAKRRQGLGRDLLHSAVDLLREEKISVLFLEVSEKNQPATALYSSFGFEMNGTRPEYIKEENGTFCDAYMMKYSLRD